MKFDKSISRYEKVSKIIPLASQTFSKSITSFPKGISPLFFEKGKGSKVWDEDGNEYIDFVNGLLSIMLGHSDDDVNNAIIEQLNKGTSFSMPHPLEGEVAELLIDLIPCAEQVRFGKNGSDATSAAIRLARAYTGRDHVAVCGYHGWQDWYIGSTARSLGVPKVTQKLTHSFHFNNIESLENVFSENKGQMAAVILEPMNVEFPKDGFLEKVRETCDRYGTVLVFDEVITGCRFSKGGAQELFGVTPDLCSVGKGLANGLPLSAIVGKTEIMKLMEDIFFSGTFGGETVSLAAAKVVLGKIKNEGILDHIHNIGKKVMDGCSELIQKHSLSEAFSIHGHPSWSFIKPKDFAGYSLWEIKTAFMQEMIKRGIFISGSHNISMSHDQDDIDKLMKAYDEVFGLLKSSIEVKKLRELLEVEPLEPLFRVRNT